MIINLYVYVIVIFAYNIYNYVKDLPFNYITQTNYDLCKKMNNTFCIRIAYFVMAIVVYLITIKYINITLPKGTPKIVNTITKLTQAFKIKIIGKQILGNLIFFNTFALSKNKVMDREKISANKPQHKIPTHR